MKEADDIRKRLSRIMDRFDLKVITTESTSPNYAINIQKALLEGHNAKVNLSNSSSCHYFFLIVLNCFFFIVTENSFTDYLFFCKRLMKNF